MSISFRYNFSYNCQIMPRAVGITSLVIKPKPLTLANSHPYDFGGKINRENSKCVYIHA